METNAQVAAELFPGDRAKQRAALQILSVRPWPLWLNHQKLHGRRAAAAAWLGRELAAPEDWGKRMVLGLENA